MKHGTALLLSTGMMLATLSAAKAGTPDAYRHTTNAAESPSLRRPLTTKKRSRFASSPRRYRTHSGRPAQSIRKWTLPYRHAATYAYQSNQVISLQEFTVRNGDTSYQVSAGTNDEGKPFASLDVYQGTPEAGKHLAEIRLAPDTVVNNISHALAEEGVVESDRL
jgi:hypothetical protein